MGVRQPGFQLLSLNPETQTHTDVPCNLPSALNTYLSIYIPLATFSLATLLILNVVRTRRNFRSAPRDQEYQSQVTADDHQPHLRSTSSFPSMTRSPRPRAGRELYHSHKFADEDAENDYDYPSFPLRPRRPAVSPPRTIKRRLTRAPPMFRKREFCVRFAKDVISVGALPAGLWVLLALWTFYGPGGFSSFFFFLFPDVPESLLVI
jgi:hypothetical protein